MSTNRLLGLVCAYTALITFKPSEPFLYALLHCSKGLSSDEVTYSVYPFWTYAYLALLPSLSAVTEIVGCRTVVVLGVLGRLSTLLLLLTSSALPWMQLSQARRPKPRRRPIAPTHPKNPPTRRTSRRRCSSRSASPPTPPSPRFSTARSHPPTTFAPSASSPWRAAMGAAAVDDPVDSHVLATGEPLKVMDKPKGAPVNVAAAGGMPAENKAQMLRRDSSVMLGALQQALGE